MRRCIKKPRSLKVKFYVAHLLDLNEYLASFPEANMTDKFGVIELNDILLNRIPNSWYKQAYVKGFYWKYIYFKNTINMFERMEISENIYEGVVTPSY